jgi:uncharacterized metal-binding protein YceD (DUF177 family)
MKPEFSRPLVVERIGATGSEVDIEADAEERDALAVRLGIPAIHAFSGHFVAIPWRRGGVQVRGEITAEVELVSVISLDEFATRINDSVVRYYQAQTAGGHNPAMLGVESLEGEEPDVLSGGTIDLGEIAAESLALALDPYPRKPGEEFQDATLQVEEERRPESPFAVLSKLKKR